jgi:hypothetical protein
MKCEDTAEYASALVDGEKIPREAAEHIGQCQVCTARLHVYAEMGAELRREASLWVAETPLAKTWVRKNKFHLWRKGWESMRIPRFAFAFLLISIVGLTSSLVLMKARAQMQGAVLMLNIKTAGNKSLNCPLLIQGQHSTPCGSIMPVKGGMLVSQYRIVAVDGSRVQLGVRTLLKKIVPGETMHSSTNDVEGLPDTEYSFEPGDKLEMQGDGAIPILITGRYMDHMPVIPGENDLDPEPNVMRIVSPVLLKNKEEVFDFDGLVVNDVERGQGVNIYTPQSGRYVLALTPIPGAIQGKVNQSRISFQINGVSYEFLMAVPVARANKAWVLHDPGFKPSAEIPGANDAVPYGGMISLSTLHALANQPH